MRSDFTPQVETREIADSDLDNISGGILGVGIDVAGLAAPVLGAIDPIVPVSGTVSQVVGMLPTQVTGALGL